MRAFGKCFTPQPHKYNGKISLKAANIDYLFIVLPEKTEVQLCNSMIL